VIGSDETMRNRPPALTTPKSRPRDGSTTTSSERAPVIPKRYFDMTSGGSFPSESRFRFVNLRATTRTVGRSGRSAF
jgi:hypothetical protein